MRAQPTCPRCGGPLRAPGLWSSDWRCASHGAVLPYSVWPRVGSEIVASVAGFARVPLWVPNPLPTGWVITGLGSAGDERTGARAAVVALSGPAPLGGGADLVLVAEEPGVGIGARYAGVPGTDPGPGFDADAPHAKVEAAGHPTALWSLPVTADCAAYVGEARGLWLWAVLWPAEAELLLLENLTLDDLRERPLLVGELPYGAPCPRLSTPPVTR